MSQIIDISTAVPEYNISKKELVDFYAKSLPEDKSSAIKKIRFLTEKTSIEHRYTCIPDYNDNDNYELFDSFEQIPSIEKRMDLYHQKVVPLASKAIDQLFSNNTISNKDITHIITVSCTGLSAPGLECALADKYNLHHAEKLPVNFAGCYAALKALKHADYIAKAEPDACILLVSVELSTLHFYPSDSNEDILANLLFADGAAATFICGDRHPACLEKISLKIDKIGTSFIPNTKNLMTWNVSSKAFRMYLSKDVVTSIKENIYQAANSLLGESMNDIDYWAIHPGGVRIVEAVQESLGLTEEQVKDSNKVLKQNGNMSSPTILFILKRLLDKICNKQLHNKQLFACAFGPGLTVEMLKLKSVHKEKANHLFSTTNEVKHVSEASI